MITISNLDSLTDEQHQYFEDAVKLVNAALVNAQFQSMFLGAVMTETKGKTNAQILEDLRADSLIDVQVYRSRWSRVVGYFTSGDSIWFNAKYMTDEITTASCLFHEFSHHQGYSHYFTWASSVPYTLNRLFEQWCGIAGV